MQHAGSQLNRIGYGGTSANNGVPTPAHSAPGPVFLPAAYPPAFPQTPQMLQGPPPLDTANPLSALMMFGAAMSAGLPGMPPLPQGFQPPVLAHSPSGGHKEPCRNYHTLGYCAAGSACPYDHKDAIPLPKAADGTLLVPVSFQ